MAKKIFTLTLILLVLGQFCPRSLAQTDTLIAGASLVPGQSLVSSGGTFALGFFSLAGVAGDTKRYYVGIWYHGIPERTVVWVANRNSPLHPTNASAAAGFLSVLADGTATVLDGQGSKIWSTADNVGISRKALGKNATLTLLDSGNLVLTRGTPDVVWQSFDHPTDTLLPTMKLSPSVRLVSWRNSSDPSAGDFYVEMDTVSPLQLLLRRRGSNETLLRYGLWSGSRKVIPIPGINSPALETEAIIVEGKDGGKPYYTFTVTDPRVLLRLHVTPTDTRLGEFKYSAWNAYDKKWILEVSAPYPPSCEVFNRCGSNGFCQWVNPAVVCSCLEGFDPREPEVWSAGNSAGGCLRREPITGCGGNVSNDDGSRFVKVSGVRLPDEFVFLRNRRTEAECSADCSSSCSCTAYAYSNFSGWDVADVRCLIWHGDLKDIVVDSIRGGDIYIRLARTGHRMRKRLFLIIMASVVGLILCMAISFIPRCRAIINHVTLGVMRREDAVFDIPFIDFKTIISATNSFAFGNKLGEGGFGPVYKGQLTTGQDIAVKRLSDRSRQGFEEFRNEVELIGKLQHTNLVRLLGWCTYQDEKILIYEYLPNKSLDKYIFDENLSSRLNWCRRYCIIEGIAQGLLYLHRFSRVRIIHRDLKTSNILLDAAMNPKISDFGLARIFGGNQKEANTNRVIGTYGYMSPEYAMHGFFSEKSDIFSFGVIVLEIISGKRGTAYDSGSDSFCLLQFAWELWNEGRGLELADPAILSSVVTDEVEACLQVGLLCVQADPADRPDISTILSMLGIKRADLPRPMQPAYFVGSRPVFSSSSAPSGCLNDITFSIGAGR